MRIVPGIPRCGCFAKRNQVTGTACLLAWRKNCPRRWPRVTGGRPVTIEVAPGELIDKITILEIKRDKIPDGAKRRRVLAELHSLQTVRDCDMERSAKIARLTAQLKRVNQRLWQAEDAIRQCEQGKDFGPRFIQLARSVYRLNDLRATLKSRISEVLGSAIVEVKHYPTSQQDIAGKRVPRRGCPRAGRERNGG